ncbi:pentapeptide repeat-containing protein [Amycolatopsis kentuckyensis]|uniref:pentapeptide repeat-containing protein n=1 Tax=Amycolatopsis kentuckyensis TaxID=218823 RepID=UPI000A3877DE
MPPSGSPGRPGRDGHERGLCPSAHAARRCAAGRSENRQLRNTALTDANLTDATLTRADFTGARLPDRFAFRDGVPAVYQRGR